MRSKSMHISARAVLSALPLLNFQPDLIHCHDWQTGLIPVYLKERFHGGDFYRNMKSVITIHNLKFQGKWDVKTVQSITGLPEYYFTSDKLEAYKDANLLKGGIVFADAVTTVSDTYAGVRSRLRFTVRAWTDCCVQEAMICAALSTVSTMESSIRRRTKIS